MIIGILKGNITCIGCVLDDALKRCLGRQLTKFWNKANVMSTVWAI